MVICQVAEQLPDDHPRQQDAKQRGLVGDGAVHRPWPAGRHAIERLVWQRRPARFIAVDHRIIERRAQLS